MWDKVETKKKILCWFWRFLFEYIPFWKLLYFQTTSYRPSVPLINVFTERITVIRKNPSPPFKPSYPADDTISILKRENSILLETVQKAVKKLHPFGLLTLHDIAIERTNNWSTWKFIGTSLKYNKREGHRLIYASDIRSLVIIWTIIVSIRDLLNYRTILFRLINRYSDVFTFRNCYFFGYDFISCTHFPPTY